MNKEDYIKLDKKLSQLNLFYKDIPVGYLIRNHLIALIRNKDGKGNQEISLNKKLLKRFFIATIKTSVNIFKRKPVWVFSNAERRKKIGHYYYDRVASIVSETYTTNTLFIENPVISNHKQPSKETILSDSFFFFGAFLFSKFFYKKKHLNLDEKLYKIANEYSVQTRIEPLIKRFIGQYFFMKFYLRKISKPKKVFLVYPSGYYGYNYAFKEFNIPIIELQHGIIYNLHPSYNTIMFKAAEQFKPDYIFTYGTKDKECLLNLNYIKENNVKVVGSYALWKMAQEKAVSPKYLSAMLKAGLQTIVVIATTNDIKELYDFCLKLENKQPNFNILLLPRFKVTRFKNTNRVKVLDVEETNIFETYKIASFLITKSSTAALEALYLGIPTFIYEPDETSVFKKNYSFLKSLNYFKTSSQLNSLINNKEYKEPLAKDIKQVYAPNVMANFTSAIDLITS